MMAIYKAPNILKQGNMDFFVLSTPITCTLVQSVTLTAVLLTIPIQNMPNPRSYKALDSIFVIAKAVVARSQLYLTRYPCSATIFL